jgi:ribosomal protein S18 acetylase RimI-like enzyme
VKKSHHRRGIASALFQAALRHYEQGGDCAAMTVNASPYALGFYRRLGFQPTDAEHTVDGLRFIPMRRRMDAPD